MLICCVGVRGSTFASSASLFPKTSSYSMFLRSTLNKHTLTWWGTSQHQTKLPPLPHRDLLLQPVMPAAAGWLPFCSQSRVAVMADTERHNVTWQMGGEARRERRAERTMEKIKEERAASAVKEWESCVTFNEWRSLLVNVAVSMWTVCVSSEPSPWWSHTLFIGFFQCPAFLNDWRVQLCYVRICGDRSLSKC